MSEARMPLPVDRLIGRLEEEINTYGIGMSEPQVHQLEKALRWAKEEKQKQEEINKARWDGVEPIPEDRSIDPDITVLLGHPGFRGLWRSRLLNQDGTVEGGWSVTFVHDGEYVEIAYESTAVKAAIKAMEFLDANGPPKVSGPGIKDDG